MDLCIITARGGSKRVPRKNIRHLAGRPLVSWPTQAAVASKLFSNVLMSTENEEIAHAAIQAGALYPFARPSDVADDFSTTADVLRVALQQWKDYSGELPEYCCCLYGTSVFVKPQQLHQARKLCTYADCVMAVAEYPHPIQRAMMVNKQGEISYLQPECVPMRTQDCIKCYHDIGLFYYFSVDAFLQHGAQSFLPLKKRAVIVPRTCAVDIDTEEDFVFAEIMAQYHGIK
jgi:pseudaminic acid cytidylyltransferase